MAADVLLGALNLSALYATGHVAVAYGCWHRRHRHLAGREWWRGLGTIPFVVAIVAWAEFLERSYYATARILKYHQAVDLWQLPWPTFTVNFVILASLMAMLVPYYVGRGYPRSKILKELGTVCVISFIVFLVALAWFGE